MILRVIISLHNQTNKTKNMDTLQQLYSNSKIISLASFLSKDNLNISMLLPLRGFSKSSKAYILTVFMFFIKSIFCSAYSLHDRQFLNDVKSTGYSYYDLMRFNSNSKYNCTLLTPPIAQTAVSIYSDLNDKGHIYTLYIYDTLREKKCKKIVVLSRTYNLVIGKNGEDSSYLQDYRD